MLRGRCRPAPGKGWGRVELAPEVRDAAVSATALAGCGRGRDGRGCGEWEKLSRERHGSVAEVPPRHGDGKKSRVPPRFFMHRGHAE